MELEEVQKILDKHKEMGKTFDGIENFLNGWYGGEFNKVVYYLDDKERKLYLDDIGKAAIDKSLVSEMNRLLVERKEIENKFKEVE